METEREIERRAYGWRIPFVMSLQLVFLGLYIRLNVSERPAFEQLREIVAQRIAFPHTS